MKLIMENFKKFVNEEELEGLSETDVIDDFLSAPVGEESSELTEGQMELWFGLQNFEMIAAIAVGIVGAVPVITTMYLAEKIANFLEDRRIDAREAARAARKKAEEEQAEAELILLTDFLLEDPTFVAALDGLVTSGSRKDVIAFNKSVRGKIKELGSMMNTSPAVLLKRLRKKAGAGDIEQRVVSDFEEKISSANPEQDAEALRKAEPASLPSRQRQKIKESIKGINKMKLTKAKLKQIIKEEIAAVRREAKEFDPVMGFDVDVAPAVPEEAEQELNDAVDYFSRGWPNARARYDYTSQEWGAEFRDWRRHRDVYQKMKQHLPADQREKIDRKVEEISRFWGEPGSI
jgi:hypothetical protein